MANQKITELSSLTAQTASPNDLTVVVDVSDLITPTGNTKNITLGEISNFVIQNRNLISSSKQLSLNDLNGPLLPVSGGTGISTPSYGSVLVGKDKNGVFQVTGSNGQTLSIVNGLPTFIPNVISSSVQVDYTKLSNIPLNIVSSSQQLNVVSQSSQVSFIGLKDTPSEYVANTIVAVNQQGTAVEFISASNSSLPIQDSLFGGKSFCNGTYYFNGDMRERIYANPDFQNLYSGSYSAYFEDFIHSGNIFLDTVNSQVYFCRGTWPRRQGYNSTDLNGFTWRESNNTGTSRAEAICRTSEDGSNFEVLIDLYAEDINNSGANSVKTSSGSFVVSEPTAVVYDYVSDKVYFACRNDHNQSIIYRMNASGSSSSDRVSSIEIWAVMHSGDLNIDSLEIATTPANFYATNNPPTNTRYLYVGVSPDYSSLTNTSSTKHAAIFKLPTTGTAPGKFLVDYPVAYTVHRFWGSGFDSSSPSMGACGVKGIKTFFAKIGGGEWNPITDSSTTVRKDKSRMYVMSSGATSIVPISNVSTIPSLQKTTRTTTLASSLPAEPQVFSNEIYGVGPGCTTEGSEIYRTNSGGTVGLSNSISVPMGTDGFPTVANLQDGDNYPTPCLPPTPATQVGSVIPAPPADYSDTTIPSANNENYGSHSLLELLIGDVAGISLTTNFSAIHDSTRLFKTWRSGILEANGGTTVLNLEFDDPAQPVGTTASGIGSARGIPFQTNDRLFILTSPAISLEYDGQVVYGEVGCRGISRIVSSDCSNNTGRYEMEGGDGITSIGKLVMVIPVLANTNDQDSDGMVKGSQYGLQQIVIDGVNEKFYIADFNYYKSWNTFLSQVNHTGNRRTSTIPSGPWQGNVGSPNVNWTPTSAGSAPYNGGQSVMSGVSAYGIPDGTVLYPGNWDFSWPQSISWPMSPTALSSLGNHPSVPGYSGLDSYTDATFKTSFSQFGQIFEGDLFVYSRGQNGYRLFNNQDPQIAYSRPCGLAGYNVGPNSEFRLIYTNGENNFKLLDNTLGFGVTLNGLSRTFVKDGVLAYGKNVMSVTDCGPGVNGGIVISMQYPSITSDYALLSNSSNFSTLGTGQQNNGNPTSSYNGVIDLTNARDDAAMYFPKSRTKFRLTYNSGELPDVVHWACFED